MGLLGPNIYPTTYRVLEQGGSFLLIKKYDQGKTISPRHDRMHKLLVKMGECEDAPGSVTVLCVWGVRATARAVVIYDHTGKSEKRALTSEDLQKWIRDWFYSRPRGR